MQAIEIHPFLVVLAGFCLVVILGIFVGVVIFVRRVKFGGHFEADDYEEANWPETLKRIKSDFKKGKI